MKIQVDQSLLFQKEGTGMYYLEYNILKNLPLNNKDIIYYFNNKRSDKILDKINPNANEVVQNAYLPIKIKSLVDMSFYYSIGANKLQNKYNIDTYWQPDMKLPLKLNKYKVVTIHDLIPLKPNNEITMSSGYRQITLKFLNYLIKNQIFNSDVIITDSESVKLDILNMFKNIKPEKIHVIYVAPNHINQQITKEDINNIKQKYNIPNEYIMTLYAIRPRKNIISIVKQYNQTNEDFQKNYSLVIAGGESRFYKFVSDEINQEIQKNKYGKIIKTGYIPDNDKGPLYQGQSVFITQSLDEGFDIPPIEQLQFNTPIAQSNISVHKEILGKLQLYFEPLDTLTLAGQMQYLQSKKSLFYTPDTYLFKNRYTWEEQSQKYYNIFIGNY